MPHYSTLAGIRATAVKDVTDLWVVKNGTFSPVQSAWVVKGGVLVKQFERRGVPVTMEWISPTPAQNAGVTPGGTVNFKVRVPTVDGLVPTGTVAFAGPGGTNTVTLDASGEAATSFVFRPGDTTVTATLSSSNGYTATAISRVLNVNDSTVSMNFVAPLYDQVYYGESNVTYKVQINGAAERLPTGTVTFNGPNGQSTNAGIWHEGGYAYAQATLWMPYGQRTVSASLNANNDFVAGSIGWRVRVMRLVRRTSWQTLWYEMAGNYPNGSSGYFTAGNELISGLTGGNDWRCFTRQNVPSKPVAGAWCTAIKVNFSMLNAVSAVTIGFHILGTLPGTGALNQAGVLSNRVWSGAVVGNTRYTVDMPQAAQAMNDTSFRGLVFGNGSNPPYARIWKDPTVDVLWEWDEWVDT